MKKAYTLALSAALLVLGLVLGVSRAPDASAQTVIQGVTPGGNFQSVAVSTDGFLLVQIGTTTRIGVAITSPVPLPVTTAVLAGTGVGSGSAAGGSSFTILSASSTVSNTLVRNTCGLAGTSSSCGAILYVGTSTSGWPILPGETYSPDNPGSFQGALVGFSTAAVTWSYIQH